MKDLAFCRQHLRLVLTEVRDWCPDVKPSEAWVWKSGRGQWEFHGPDRFYWHGRAANAYDARAKGWQSYLAKHENWR
jgi:hypothetical protein